MNPKTLIVGDVHATPQELAECRALEGLITKTVEREKIDLVVFLGDQYHNHNVMDSRVLNFWTHMIHFLPARQVYLVGNHDQVSPTTRFPHSMVAHKLVEDVGIVDAPCNIPGTSFCAMPFYCDKSEFVNDAIKLKKIHENCEVLFCHQTFTGADASLGFHADDSIDPALVPFKIIISGHIHAPMRLGKVWYPGAPRWRNLKDADVADRAIFILEQGKPPVPVPTNTWCVRIYKFEDTESNPAVINLTPEELMLADVRVTVYGSQEYISKRVVELKNKYRAKCRSIPLKSKLARVSESDGTEVAFSKFADSFVPPYGTEKQVLLTETSRRINEHP